MGLATEDARPGGALAFGFALATFGGPLALAALHAPGVAGPALPSVGLATLLGAAAFALPVSVWWRYSGRISSSGGLIAFVQEAAGRRLALAAGATWTVSYFLYLPNTVAEISTGSLPTVFPGMRGWGWALQLALPLAATAFVLAPLRLVFAAFGVAALAQLAVLLALGVVELRRVGTPASSLTVHGEGGDLAVATFGMSLLFVCGSLAFFFGGEVRGGGIVLRKAVAAALVVAAAYAVFAAFPLAAAPRRLLGGDLPGYDVASAYSGRGFAVVVGVMSILSDALLVLAEFLALSRLLHWATRRPVRTTTLWIAVPFLAASALAIPNGEEFYETFAKPSLVALWAAQLLVFAAFPLLRRRRPDLLVAAACAALSLWALYRIVYG